MKIAAVIVTYNRLELLKEVLESFDNQIKCPDYVIVVNNASTDTTGKFLDEWMKKDCGNVKMVITSKTNVGGSGGFYLGTERAMQTDADWIWVSDDDAIPNDDVFIKAYNYIGQLDKAENVSAICTAVYTNGSIVETNRSRRIKKMFEFSLDYVSKEEYKSKSFECDEFSYVGVLMNKEKLREVGLIHAGYFIWRDDVEHSWRLSDVGKIICFPDMIVNHKANAADYNGVSWKTYYAYRNDLLMLKEHCSYRYVLYKKIKTVLRGVSAKTKQQKRLYFDAISGANAGEQGLSEKYRPGMKIE